MNPHRRGDHQGRSQVVVRGMAGRCVYVTPRSWPQRLSAARRCGRWSGAAGVDPSMMLSWRLTCGTTAARSLEETMNRYGAMALTHWRRWTPTRFALIEDPDSFFTRLGQDVADQITSTEESLLASADLTGLDAMARAGRLTAIRRQAEEIVLTEMVWLEPEPGTDPMDETFQTLPDPDPLDQWMDEDGMPLDRCHPLWAMLTDESLSPADFARRLRAWGESLPRD